MDEVSVEVASRSGPMSPRRLWPGCRSRIDDCPHRRRRRVPRLRIEAVGCVRRRSDATGVRTSSHPCPATQHLCAPRTRHPDTARRRRPVAGPGPWIACGQRPSPCSWCGRLERTRSPPRRDARLRAARRSPQLPCRGSDDVTADQPPPGRPTTPPAEGAVTVLKSCDACGVRNQRRFQPRLHRRPTSMSWRRIAPSSTRPRTRRPRPMSSPPIASVPPDRPEAPGR